MDEKKLRCVVEAILFVAGEALSIADLAHALDMTAAELIPVLDSLRDEYDREERGVRLNRFGMSVQLSTRPDYAPYIERLLQPVQKQSLSQAAMETLSIIAFKQPITKPEIEQLRGVRVERALAKLLELDLICELGRKQVIGRPILYGTTATFLRCFGLDSLDDLPQLPDVPEQPEQPGQADGPEEPAEPSPGGGSAQHENEQHE